MLASFFLEPFADFWGLLFWYLAIAIIDISLATVLLNTMPLFITLLSALMGHDSIGKNRILAVMFGFGGVLLILLPIKADFNLIGVSYALLGAFFCGAHVRIYTCAWEKRCIYFNRYLV